LLEAGYYQQLASQALAARFDIGALRQARGDSAPPSHGTLAL